MKSLVSVYYFLNRLLKSLESIPSWRILPVAHKMPPLPVLAERIVHCGYLSWDHLNYFSLWSDIQPLFLPLCFGVESWLNILDSHASCLPFLVPHEQTMSFPSNMPVVWVIPPQAHFMPIIFWSLYSLSLPLINLKLLCIKLSIKIFHVLTPHSTHYFIPSVILLWINLSFSLARNTYWKLFHCCGQKKEGIRSDMFCLPSDE